MHHPITQPTPGPETTEAALYKPFQERLLQLSSDREKGRLAWAIIHGFFHPKPHSCGEHD